MKFCLDTNAFIEPWRSRYPIDVFPTFWQTLDEWGRDGVIVAPEEVLHEIEKVDDELLAWLKVRRYIFEVPDEVVQQKLKAILAQFQRLVDTKKGRSIADPWVIAQAQVLGAIVVTEEVASKGKSPKIPDVCESLKVPYTNVLGLIRKMKLKF
jgi:predicted nucleic acid-binding protein